MDAQINSVTFRIILFDFPHQTTESVTNVVAPCEEGTCSRLSNIVIPGIGEGSVEVLAHLAPKLGPELGSVKINHLPGQSFPAHIFFELPGTPRPIPFLIDGIRRGLAFIQVRSGEQALTPSTGGDMGDSAGDTPDS